MGPGPLFRPFRGHFGLGATPLRHVGRLRFPEDIRHEHQSDGRSTPVLNGCPIGSLTPKRVRVSVSPPKPCARSAMRRKWPRRRPNDDRFGRVQVLVPDDAEINLEQASNTRTNDRWMPVHQANWTPCVTPWNESETGQIGPK